MATINTTFPEVTSKDSSGRINHRRTDSEYKCAEYTVKKTVTYEYIYDDEPKMYYLVIITEMVPRGMQRFEVYARAPEIGVKHALAASSFEWEALDKLRRRFQQDYWYLHDDTKLTPGQIRTFTTIAAGA